MQLYDHCVCIIAFLKFVLSNTASVVSKCFQLVSFALEQAVVN